MRRLLYLSYSKIPSAYANSLQVLHMCHALANEGWKVDLYCLKTASKENPWSYYDLAPNAVRIHRILMPRIKVISRFLYGLRVIFSMPYRHLNEAVVYGRDFYTLALFSLLKISNTPIYLEAHQPPGDKLEAYLQKIIFRSPYFAGLVVISHALKAEYVRKYGSLVADKVFVSHDAARPQTTTSTLDTVLPSSDKLRLGYVGSLQEGKGMEIISRIAPSLSDVELHIVGGQARQIAYWKERCPENVFFHGFKKPSEVGSFLQAFEIVVAPYQSAVKVGNKKVDIARWMSPLKLFEYMAARKAIIASDLAVLKEVLVHEKNALLADPDNINSWVHAIKKLQKDQSLRVALGNEAQKNFLQHFTWQHRARQLIELFENNRSVIGKTVHS